MGNSNSEPCGRNLYRDTDIKSLRKNGFGEKGPVKGSVAAKKQSELGNIPKGHKYCELQRKGMTAVEEHPDSLSDGILLMARVAEMAVDGYSAIKAMKRYYDERNE